jgi:hypothetical protein
MAGLPCPSTLTFMRLASRPARRTKASWMRRSMSAGPGCTRGVISLLMLGRSCLPV